MKGPILQFDSNNEEASTLIVRHRERIIASSDGTKLTQRGKLFTARGYMWRVYFYHQLSKVIDGCCRSTVPVGIIVLSGWFDVQTFIRICSFGSKFHLSGNNMTAERAIRYAMACATFHTRE